MINYFSSADTIRQGLTGMLNHGSFSFSNYEPVPLPSTHILLLIKKKMDYLLPTFNLHPWQW